MGTLNLVVHGLFAIVEEPYRVVLAAPHVDDHDKYLLQVQGDPKPLRYGRGNFELVGVKTGQASAASLGPLFPPDQNARVGQGADNYTEVFTVAPPAYATFILPRPLKVHCCQFFCRGKDVVFIGKDSADVGSQYFARIIVLVYDFDNVETIRFTGLPGFKAHYKPLDTDKYVNVAVISRGQHANAAAVSAAFDKMMSDLVPEKDIHLYALNPNAKPTGDCSIPGIDRATFDAFAPIADFLPDDCIPLVVNNA